ncbi:MULTISPECIES: hypothetical protein [unclassified Ruegeria]|nr:MULTISPECIES: hypothetical protein [unclassified Ruegeria]
MSPVLTVFQIGEFSAGAAMAILALIADRIVQGFAEERRAALGL